MNLSLPLDGPAEPAKVLVVDDVPQNLLAMQALLQRDGVQVLTADSGPQALELLLEHEVALALLDVQMPGMDGFALAELMRGAQRSRQVPIIFMTASPDDPGRSFQGYETGAVDFLHKPVDPRIIRSKVQVFVELHHQRILLRQRNEALERVLKLNETMVAVLTHDLRTPLSAILMNAEVLRIHAKDPASERSAARLKASGLRMGRMIEQLLDLTRIRSGVLQVHPREADLEAVVHAALAEIRQAHPNAQIDCRTEGNLLGRFDSDRLLQVVSNLVGNAVQHGTPGSRVQVSVDGRAPHELRLAVTNAGQIAPELLPRIFDPFKTVAEKASDGLGLGLYIVEQFVRAHGGTVSATNTPEGARFQVTIPREGRASD